MTRLKTTIDIYRMELSIGFGRRVTNRKYANYVVSVANNAEGITEIFKEAV